MPWYCSGNGSYLDSILGCPSGIMSEQEQLDAVRGNFGGHADPNVVNKTVSDFKTWLDTTDYGGKLDAAKKEDSINLSLPEFVMPDFSGYYPLLIGIAVFALVAMGGGGSRRYGR